MSQSGSELIDLRTSRFPDGIMVHYDYCWEANTKIKLLDGRVLTIKELSNTFRENQLYTYSHAMDDQDSQLTFGSILNVWPTKIAKTLLEVTLGNGFKLRLTGNHKLCLLNRREVEAKDLEIGDSLISLYEDDKYFFSNCQSYEIFDEDTTHANGHVQLVDESIKHRTGGRTEGQLVRHKDSNKKNNAPENLEYISWQEHMAIHHMPKAFSWLYHTARELMPNNISKGEQKLGWTTKQTKAREALRLLLTRHQINYIKQKSWNRQSWSKELRSVLNSNTLPKGMGLQIICSEYGSFQGFLDQNKDLLNNHKVVGIRAVWDQEGGRTEHVKLWSPI